MRLRALLVDPSLYTAPYDAALDGGLRNGGVETGWATRSLRLGEEAELAADRIVLRFYPRSERDGRRPSGTDRIRKGFEHIGGMMRLARLAHDYDVVHFQWSAMPSFDRFMMRRIRRTRPVLLTVHDTTPLNGAEVDRVMVSGFHRLFDAADHLIVHTAGAQAALEQQGVPPSRISIVPHGPLPLRAAPRPVGDKVPGRWRIVLFGRLQAYKGVDLLVEALGTLDAATRARLEVIVAGEPLVALAPIEERARALGLTEPTLILRPGRLSDQEMADLLGSADAFVFPYRAIEASGVLFLVAGLRKWMIASALGAFADTIGTDDRNGTLVPPDDAAALGRALADSIGRTPAEGAASLAPSWDSIGKQTAGLYRRLIEQKKGRRGHDRAS